MVNINKKLNKDREYWVNLLVRISRPVLEALSARKLHELMPVEGREDRPKYAHLEAIGRLLAGIAPWLELQELSGDEEKLRQKYANMAREAIDAATDPESPDFMNFNNCNQAITNFAEHQPIVDLAFLGHGFLRAPTELWDKLEDRVKKNVIKAFKSSRKIRPANNNWILFSALIETALYLMGEDWDAMRVDTALYLHDNWFLGDGTYGDGPIFFWNYYNSFVIHPMLIDIITTVADEDTWKRWPKLKVEFLKRARRYAEVQEHLISPEGTFPPIGRSLAYRIGAFQLLSQMALKHQLPDSISPAQVRSALTSVYKNMMETPGTYDENGWLKIGFCGSQAHIGEVYISTGSLYLCSTGLLALGLAAEDDFWQEEAEDWTSKKLWSGRSL